MVNIFNKMNSHQLISKFISQICEKEYSAANNSLQSILEGKLKQRIKKEAEKLTKKDKKKPMTKKKSKGAGLKHK